MKTQIKLYRVSVTRMVPFIAHITKKQAKILTIKRGRSAYTFAIKYS